MTNKYVIAIFEMMVFFVVIGTLFITPVYLTAINHNAWWCLLYLITAPIGYWLTK